MHIQSSAKPLRCGVLRKYLTTEIIFADHNHFRSSIFSRFLAKTKKIFQNFSLLAFLFLRYVLVYYFLFLGKSYNNQNQERFIIYQKEPLDVLAKKRCS